jgi:uncharacterized membrane protein
MTVLISGLLVFALVHLLPSVPRWREALIARLGLGPYKGLFTLVSLAGLALIVAGKMQAPLVPLWEPAASGYEAPRWAMPLSFVLLAGAYLPGNLRRMTRHPMLWGVMLWAVSHLFANGDLASVLIFAAFGGYSLLAMWSQSRRGARLQTRARPPAWDVLVVAVGLAAYAAFGLAHPYVVGVPAFR